MIRLTFTDEKKNVKILGESNDKVELFTCMMNHANRLFIHPTCSFNIDLSQPGAVYTVGRTAKGCVYQMHNIG